MEFLDQMGRRVRLEKVPERIVSLVPSQSEFIWDLGLRPAGITKFCVHPQEMRRGTPLVGGTKSLDIKKIEALRPDLVIGNKEENLEAQILSISEKWPVWMSDINTIGDALGMMRSLAHICGREEQGRVIINKTGDSLRSCRNIFPGQRTLYLIWKDPYMAAAGNTFIGEMLTHAGLVNVAASLRRYPELSLEQIKELAPRLILLSSEPYPFSEKHLRFFRETFPDARTELADGEMFSWYGSRLALAGDYLNRLAARLNDGARHRADE